MSKPTTLENLRTVLRFVGFEWSLLLGIFILELKLAYALPGNILSMWPVFGSLVDLLEHGILVLSYITDETAKRPEAVRFYILFTLSLMPIKVWLFYRWLNRNPITVYRFHVITPLTDQQPASSDFLITESLREERGQVPRNRSRSLFSRLFWSTLILLLTAGSVVVLSMFEPTPTAVHWTGQDPFISVVSEGFGLWFEWAMTCVAFPSLMLAISSCIIRDYGIIIKRLFSPGKEERP